ncbi:MAG: hypothetical protein CSA82_02835 [Actinobacteria bacterium]|nr:MAG: hypothetical protein CSA82_02835 [Actinomycetota bacterium]
MSTISHSSSLTPTGEILLWIATPLVAAAAFSSLLRFWQLPSFSPDSLALVLILTATALLMLWNVISLALARCASMSRLPTRIRRTTINLVQAVGTRSARDMLIRRGAYLALGTQLATATFSPSAYASAPADAFSSLSHPLSVSALPSPGNIFPVENDRDIPLPSPQLSPPNHSNSVSPPSEAMHTVNGGESLWTIAHHYLGEDTSPSEIANFWPHIYATNHTLIGSNPNIIRPGMSLRIPLEDR